MDCLDSVYFLFIIFKILSGLYQFFSDRYTAWKVSKYGVFSGPYFPVFGLNTKKYGPEKTPYSDTFYAVVISAEPLFQSFLPYCHSYIAFTL